MFDSLNEKNFSYSHVLFFIIHLFISALKIMCTLLKTIAYGTRITPTIAKNIIGSFPERSLLDCAQVSFHVNFILTIIYFMVALNYY